MGAAPTFESEVHQPNKNKTGVQVLLLDLDNGNRTQAEAFRQITGATAPMLMQAGKGDYAGARLEDVVVIDQQGAIRYTTNWVEGDHHKINQAVEALLNKYPIITLSERRVYLGISLEVGQSKSTSFEISNAGEVPLEITGFTAPAGIVVQPPTFTLQTSETKTIEITLTPIQSGELEGLVTLNHNNPNVDALQLPLWPLTIEPGQIATPADPRTDFDNSGKVDFADFLTFVSKFGSTESTYDLDASNTVDFGDFLIFVQNFGKTISE